LSRWGSRWAWGWSISSFIYRFSGRRFRSHVSIYGKTLTFSKFT
jgi:hypothetical protein